MSGIGLALSGLSIASKLTGAGNAAKGFLAAIPKPVWEAIAVLGYALALIALHQHAVHEHDASIISANNAQWQARLNAAAAQMKAKDVEIASMSAQLRKVNDEANQAIAADAAAQRVRGPGKAACPGVSGAAPSASGPQPSSRPGDAPLAQLPGTGGLNLIALPFADTIDFGAEHDSYRAEVTSWRAWYGKLIAAWPKGAAAKP